MPVKRIYVERRPGFFNVQAQRLCNELRSFLDLPELRYVRLFRCYDMENISDEDFSQVRDIAFANPAVDVLYEENLPDLTRDFVFAYEVLPGEYDELSDLAEQCVQIVIGKQRPIIRTSCVVSVSNSIGQEAFEKVKKYCINAQQYREISLDKPQSLVQGRTAPITPEPAGEVEAFIDLPDSMLLGIAKRFGLSLTVAELSFCRNYFRDKQKRNPTEMELLVIDAFWRKRRQKRHFVRPIEAVSFAEGNYKKIFSEAFGHYEANRCIKGEKEAMTLQDVAQMGLWELKRQNGLMDVDFSQDSDLSGIIVPAMVGGKQEDWLVLFQNEQAGRSLLAPEGEVSGRCLGSVVRDPLSGRSYVYQAMRITACGEPNAKDPFWQGGRPQLKATREAASGSSVYASRIGVPVGYVREYYHPGYGAEHLEAALGIGAVRKEDLNTQPPEQGDLIVVIGGAPGHGGIFAEENARADWQSRSRVKHANALIERRLQRLLHNREALSLIKRCRCVEEGGICLAAGELAAGVYLNLDFLQDKYQVEDGAQLALGEVKERLVVLLKREDAPKLMQLCGAENLTASIAGTVIDEEILHVVCKDEAIVDLPREILFSSKAQQPIKVQIEMPDAKKSYFMGGIIQDCRGMDFAQLWLENLRDYNVCGQEGLIEQFDATVGTKNLLLPLGGYWQRSASDGMASLLPTEDCETATLASCGFDPHLAQWSPFHAGFYAVIEALSKIVAMGGNYARARLCLQERFAEPGEDGQKWGKSLAALLGAYWAQVSFGTAVIGGNESLSGAAEGKADALSFLAYAVCPVEAENIISSEFKLAGNEVYILPLPHDAYDLPDCKALQRNFAAVRELVENKKVYSALSIGKGGVAAAVSKMCMGENLGFRFNDSLNHDLQKLFAPLYGALLIEVSAGAALDELKDTHAYLLGKVHKVPSIVCGNDVVTVEEAVESYNDVLEEVFPTRIVTAKSNMSSRNMLNNNLGLKAEKVFSLPSYDISLSSNRGFSKPFSSEFHCQNPLRGTWHLPQPQVFIPVFPGTSCEYDLEAAFKKAGAAVETVVFKNLTEQSVKEALETLATKIRKAQILALPGGFLGHEQADSCSTFVAAALSAPRVLDAVQSLLYRQDGLIVGFSSGFQALLKLGLLPYGHICRMMVDSPSLSCNEIGRRVARIVQTKVVSDLSPWFNKAALGHLAMAPVSHAQGRFFASSQMLAQLRKNGQIATQYVDGEGNVSMDSRYNPNGSVDAIEGITSPDGRVLGKMAHNERSLDGLSINVLRNQEQYIFESGVEYFR